MSRVWRREIVAIRCDVRSCSEKNALIPALSQDTTWHDLSSELEAMVRDGWSAVITPMFRTYCPEHAHRARECTCRTNPSRRHLCVVHTPEVAELIWDTNQIPTEVIPFLKVAAQ